MDTQYLNFSPRLKEIVETGKSLNLKGEVIKTSGVSTLNNIRIMRELVIKEKFSKTLEIGLAFGVSALTLLSTLKEVSADNFHHTAIDPFQTNWGGSGLKVISDEGFSNHFTLHEDLSALVLPTLFRNSEQYDLIYIDGSHLFEDVFIDFYYSVQILRKGGIVLFDDCRDSHVLKVIKFIRTNYAEFLSEIDYGVGENPHRPLKKRIGNFLGVRQLFGFQKTEEPPRKWNAKYKDF